MFNLASLTIKHRVFTSVAKRFLAGFFILYLLPNLLIAQDVKPIDPKSIGANKADTLKVYKLNTLADELSGQYFDSALAINTEALLLAQKLDWTTGIANSYQIMGVIYDNKGEYPLALKYYQSALELWKGLLAKSPGTTKFKRRIAVNYSSIGITYRNQSDFVNALKYQLLSLQLDEENKDSLSLAADYANLGSIYCCLKNPEKGLDYYLRSETLTKRFGNKDQIVTHYYNIGNVYVNLKDYNKALQKFSVALQLSEELNNKNYLAAVLGGMAIVFDAQKNTKKSLEYLLRALQLHREVGYKAGIIIVSGNIGELYAKTGEFKKAEASIQESFTLAKGVGSLDDVMTAHQHFANLYNESKDYKKALEHYHLYNTLKDSLYNGLKERELAKLEVKYQFEKETAVKDAKHASDIALLLKEKQVSDYKKYFLITALLFLVVTALVLYSRQRIKTKKQKEAFDLQQKITEGELKQNLLEKQNLHLEMEKNIEKLNNYTTLIQENTKLLDKLQEELEELKNKNQNIEFNEEHFLNSVKESMNPEIYWEEFISSFNIVYKDFLEKLSARYPDLTRSEIRLCILVKCNLGNKEIANVLHISADSVKKAHNRIRKTFNLDPSENLRKFIQQIA